MSSDHANPITMYMPHVCPPDYWCHPCGPPMAQSQQDRLVSLSQHTVTLQDSCKNHQSSYLHNLQQESKFLVLPVMSTPLSTSGHTDEQDPLFSDLYTPDLPPKGSEQALIVPRLVPTLTAISAKGHPDPYILRGVPPAIFLWSVCKFLQFLNS